MIGSEGFDALITAGGFGTRFGPDCCPKSMLEFGGTMLLRYAVLELVEAGCAKILVSTNRPEFVQRIVAEFADVQVVTVGADPGYSSTLEVARFWAPSMSRYFLFGYGHAIRSADVLRQFQKKYECFATFAASTRRDLIVLGGRYVEPPFSIDRDRLMLSRSRTWSSYLNSVSSPTLIRVDELPEPNTFGELQQFMQDWAHGHAFRRLLVPELDTR